MEFLNDAYKHCKVIGADGKTELIKAPFASNMPKR
jgi:catalase